MRSKIIKALSILATSIFLFSCNQTKITSDYDTNTNFSQLKTYQWNKQPSVAFEKAKPLIHQRIIKAIDENMQNKGFSLTESADVTLSYSLGFEKKLQSSNLSIGLGMAVGSHGNINLNSGNRLKQTTEGRLDIRMISSKDNTLVWRSTSVKPLDNRQASPEESEKRIGQLIYKMLESYPPKSK